MTTAENTLSPPKKYGMLAYVLKNRFILTQLAKRDFKSRYVGSSLGFLWAILQPLSMMAILWFVFEFGLKAKHVSGDISFVAWFFTAMILWNYIADVLLVNTNVLSEFSFMLRKTEFDPIVLPLVKILSSLVIHGVFFGILTIILMIQGIPVSWYWLGLVYYLFATTVFLLGFSYLTAALNPFVKDTGQIVSILVQFGFWLTPIIWNLDLLSPKLQQFIKLNPIIYLTEGYRNSLLYQKAFWQVPVTETLYFWAITCALLVGGIKVFRKMKPHFTDVI